MKLKGRAETYLAHLKSLTPGDFAEVKKALVEEFDRVDAEETTPESVAEMNRLADAADDVIAAEATVEEPEPVAASARRRDSVVASMARRRMGEKPFVRPERLPPRTGAVLTASAAMGSLVPGAAIEDRYALAEGMCEQLGRMDRRGPARGVSLVASARWHYPEERQLGDSPGLNSRRLEAACAPQALLATGGICAPVNVDYSVPTWATADRPLRDGLASFQATRGGIRFVQPPDISDLADATGIWTEATDAAPGAETKPVLTVVCGSQEEVLLAAIPTRLKFGNMQGRFAPEQVAANTDLAIAAAARIAENNLLDLIAAQCVKGVANAEIVLGATRDLLMMVDQACAQMRQIHRLPDEQLITGVFPRWVRDLIRVDLTREVGHDNGGEWNVLKLSNEQVAELLRARGVNPIFHLDGQNAEVEGGVSQVFAAPAKGAIKKFPSKLVAYMFPEGQMQFLDGGRLDLGVVRDATLDATNDYETFIETFESIAFRGYANGGLQLVSELCASGGSAGTVSTAGKCA